MDYMPRFADAQLSEGLAMAGAVVIEGPRGCGKTQTARKAANSAVYFDVDSAAIASVDVNPNRVLNGAHPRLLDEWQMATAIWNKVRKQLDETREMGQFILTGSVTPPVDPDMHPGATRIERIRMRPLSLSESGVSNNSVSLAALLAGTEDYTAPQIGALSFDALLAVICSGGWPRYSSLTSLQAMRMNRSYLQDLFRVDFARLPGSSNPATAERVLRELARLTGSTAAYAKIAGQLSKNGANIKATTVQAYAEQLTRLFILEEIPAWLPHLRSRYTVTQSPKRYLVDPSLAVAALSANQRKLESDLETTGFLFENLVIRDLLAITESLHGRVYHYRDESQVEVDAIVEAEDGSWGAIEIKLGYGSVETAASSLLRFRNAIDTNRMGEPAFLAVVTNSDYSFLRPDGVHVISITALGA